MNEDPTLAFGAGQPERPGVPAASATWGPFNLLARVGAGGFGEVYRAWDPALQREVALKLLLPGAVDSDKEYAATLREARALAAVRHPNIVSIYGIDRNDGRVGFWTDFVHGKTLSALLSEQGPFGFREAAFIGLDVTRALAAVHRAGLLHRDIKPENVMREAGGRILLMDFGLSSLPQRTLQLAGTPNYMAPELFSGADASVATDIYAVGVLLYYLVTSTHPVKLNGLTVEAAAQAFAHRKPLADLRSDLPESFLRVVSTATDPDPARRFSSAGHMAECLAEAVGAGAPAQIVAAPTTRRFARPLIATALLIAVGGYAAMRQRASSHPAAAPSGVAASSYTRYLAAQDLLQKNYKEANVTQAIDQFQSLAASDPKFALAEAGLGSAYFLRYRSSQDPKMLELAEAATNRAIVLDPDSAPAYVTLARIAAMQGNNALANQLAQKALGFDKSNADANSAMAEVLIAEGHDTDAVAAFQKSIDQAPDDPRFPMKLGNFYLRTGKLDLAEAQFKRAVEVAQDDSVAFYNLGLVYMRLNKLEDARINIQRSAQLEPDADTFQALSWLLVAEGKFQQAVDANQKAVALAPNSYTAWANLGSAYLQLPDGEAKARDAYRKAVELAEPIRRKEPKNADLLASLAYYHLRTGEVDRSRTLLRQALALSTNDPQVDYIAGEISEILGNRAEAIRFIVKCIGPAYSMAEIARDPDLKALRADPAFLAAAHTADADAAEVAAKKTR